MDTFRFITTILSLVLGLGMTRLLTSLIAVFRSRRRAHIDWLPLAWAFGIFFTMLQYWWAISNLPMTMTDWSFEEFVGLVTFTVLLFVSAALLLPLTEMDENGSLRAFFDTDGRWALLALSAYFALTLLVDRLYFKAPLLEPWAALNLVAMALPLGVFLSRSRSVQATLTLVAVPFFVLDLVAMSDESLLPYLRYEFAP